MFNVDGIELDAIWDSWNIERADLITLDEIVIDSRKLLTKMKDDSLICQICQGVTKEPETALECDNCSANFCNSCIEEEQTRHEKNYLRQSSGITAKKLRESGGLITVPIMKCLG